MQKVSFVAPFWEKEKHCLFCFEKLGNVECFKLKTKKICKCKKCGKITDK